LVAPELTVSLGVEHRNASGIDADLSEFRN
jgi:hypothetical protein